MKLSSQSVLLLVAIATGDVDAWSPTKRTLNTRRHRRGFPVVHRYSKTTHLSTNLLSLNSGLSSNMEAAESSYPSMFQSVSSELGTATKTSAEVTNQIIQSGLQYETIVKKRSLSGGTWIRAKPASNNNVINYLLAHGLNSTYATQEATRRYTQSYRITNERTDVYTHTLSDVEYEINTDEGRRISTYKLSNWKEECPSNSTLCGSSMFDELLDEEWKNQVGRRLERRTYWNGTILTTISKLSDGCLETSERFLEYRPVEVPSKKSAPSAVNVGIDAESTEDTDQVFMKEVLVLRRTLEKQSTMFTCEETFLRNSDVDSPNMSLKRVPGCANVDLRVVLVPIDTDTDTKLYGVQINGVSLSDELSRGLLALVAGSLEGKPQLASTPATVGVGPIPTTNNILALEAANVPHQLGLEKVLSSGQIEQVSNMVTLIQSQIRRLMESLPATTFPTQRDYTLTKYKSSTTNTDDKLPNGLEKDLMNVFTPVED